jgi:hypothetical protein
LKSISKTYYYYLALAAVSAVYITASLLAPLGANRFNLTPAKTHLLQLTIYLPIVLVWWIAVFGAERFKNYTRRIKEHKDGRGLNKISTGLIILVVSIILGGLFGVLRPWALQNGWLAAFTNINNHLSVVGPLIAYGFIYAGSVDLKKLPKKHPTDYKRTVILLLFLALIAAWYIVQLVGYEYLETTPNPARYSSFYMSTPLVLLTIALPYLVGWGLGIKAALNLAEYRRQVKGLIYREMLLRLVIGTLVVIGFYFAVQLLVAFSTFFARAGLGAILLVVYLLILSYAVGFLMIASGARKLSRIEEV